MKNATELKTHTDNYFKKKANSCYEDSSCELYKNETPLFLNRQEKIVQQVEDKKEIEKLATKKNPVYYQLEESIFKKIAEKIEQSYSDLVKWVAPYNLHDSMLLALIIYMSPTTNLNKIIIDCFKITDYDGIGLIKQIILQKAQNLEGKSNEFLLNLSETKKILTELSNQAIDLWEVASKVLLEYKNSPEHILVADIIKSNINHYTKFNNNIHDRDLLTAIENTLSKFL